MNVNVNPIDATTTNTTVARATMANTTASVATGTPAPGTPSSAPANVAPRDAIFAFKVYCYQRTSPKGQRPCDYLESPQYLPPGQFPFKTPGRIIAREHGGSYDNHVQWIDSCKLDVYNHTEIAFAHGVLVRDIGEHNKKGDKVWLLSQLPGSRVEALMVRVVNLDRIIETEVSVNEVKWRPNKRLIADRGLNITFSGPSWPGASGVMGNPPLRMCVQFRSGNSEIGPEGDNKEGGGARYGMIRLFEVNYDHENIPVEETLDELSEVDGRRGILSIMFGWLG